jgi:hypothetical protein
MYGNRPYASIEYAADRILLHAPITVSDEVVQTFIVPEYDAQFPYTVNYPVQLGFSFTSYPVQDSADTIQATAQLGFSGAQISVQSTANVVSPIQLGVSLNGYTLIDPSVSSVIQLGFIQSSTIVQNESTSSSIQTGTKNSNYPLNL